MNGIFANYLWTMFWGSIFWIFWIMWIFPRKYIYRCIRVYVWFKDDKHVIWMWIWLILKNMSLLDRIWSLWLIRFAHSPPNFIFWLGRLIFSVSINSHPDNIYLSAYLMKITYSIQLQIFYTWWRLHTQSNFRSFIPDEDYILNPASDLLSVVCTFIKQSLDLRQ